MNLDKLMDDVAAIRKDLAGIDKKLDITSFLVSELKDDLIAHVRASKEHEAKDAERFEKVDESLTKLDRHATQVKFAAGALIVLAPLLMGLYKVVG